MRSVTPPRLSNKLRILRVMIFAVLDNEPFMIRKHSDPAKQIIRSGGYRPISFFRGPFIGGDAADVRLRNLRTWLRSEYGLVVSDPHYHKYYDPVLKEWKKYHVPSYNLEMSRDEILRYPWERIFPPGTLDLRKYRKKIIPINITEGINGQFVMVV